MPKECEGCNWTRTVWCSVRDRLVSKGLTPPCVSEDTDATIRKLRIERLDLRVERDGIDQRCSELEQELAEAQAREESLRRQLERERDEAEVTIEGWCKSRRYWRQQCENARKQAKEAEAVVRSLAAETDGLADAKAEIAGLNSKLVAMAIKVDVRRTAADNWLQRCKEADRELAEARETIERLRKERDALRTDLGEALRGREYQIREKVDASEGLAKAKAEIERLRNTIHHHNERFSSLYAEFIEIKEELESYTNSVNADAEIGRLVREMRPGTCFWRREDGCYAARTLLLGVMTRPILVSDFITGREYHDPADALRSIQKEVGDEPA